MKSIIAKYLVGLFVLFLLSACGEQISDSNSPDALGASNAANNGLGTSNDPIVSETGDIAIKALSSGESQSGSLTQGEWQYYSIDTTSDDTDLVVNLTNLSSDVDLYVRSGPIPILDNYDCRPYEEQTISETCTLPNSVATTWYIGVYGFTTGSFTIKATRSSKVTSEPVATDNNSNSDNTYTPSALIASGPIVISADEDVIISGLHISNPDGPCIEIGNYSANIIIENSEIGPCGASGIDITYSQNITIQNNYIHDTGYMGIYSYSAHTITVDNNRIETVVSGYGAFTNRLDGVRGPISFTNNYVKNMSRSSDYPAKGGNCASLQYVSGGGLRINDNTCINVPGESNAEDIINVYWSNGLSSDPIQIMRNKTKGGGPSVSGGGIIVGDAGGSNTLVDGNILIDPGQYGIAVAGGHNHTLTNNKIYAKDQVFTNVGLYVWRQNPSDYTATQPGTCYGIQVEFNEVNWTSGKTGSLNPKYNPDTGSDGGDNCGVVDGWSNNDWYSDEVFQF